MWSLIKNSVKADENAGYISFCDDVRGVLLLSVGTPAWAVVG